MCNKNRIVKLMSIYFMLLIFSCTDKSEPTSPNFTLDEKLQKSLDDGIHNLDGMGISAAIIFPSLSVIQDCW